jgi:transketolase
MMDTEALARAIRRHCLTMTHRANASHVGSALSMADLVAVLYGQVMRIDPAHPKHPDRDRFILSKGHACTAVYAVLAEMGYFERSELAHFGEDQSRFMTHISHKVPGVEFSTGSLGHGLPFGVGKALAARRRGAPWRTYVLVGDGELAEGSHWEAALFAAHHGLDNLVLIVDANNLQSLTTVDATLRLDPLCDKFRAFGWAVREVDGHAHPELKTALSATPWECTRPSLLIARTLKGKGVSFMEGSVHWHYKSPNAQQLALALAELETPPHA